ncbi:Membrane steroid-binding protein [Actinidia chinensis var. chinensis]|uniref:Membrane steroid-binding protein n=1 Tax=Actinidia chinensis var. chinensis TaxID=1590841 RepID=A0A2R6RAD3_ACTCC|nr:Membrane steroid-binding protein [Actinidia chinensis var. chinensis]
MVKRGHPISLLGASFVSHFSPNHLQQQKHNTRGNYLRRDKRSNNKITLLHVSQVQNLKEGKPTMGQTRISLCLWRLRDRSKMCPRAGCYCRLPRMIKWLNHLRMNTSPPYAALAKFIMYVSLSRMTNQEVYLLYSLLLLNTRKMEYKQ